MIHEAFIYASDDEYAATLAPFLAEAVDAGEYAVAIVARPRIALLREALGARHASVSFVDAGEWYRRPGATLAAWRAELDAQHTSVRAIGEVVFADSAQRWTRYESLINRVFAGRAAWIVCPYDERALPADIVAAARRTHPVVSTSAGRVPSAEHFAAADLGAALLPSAGPAIGGRAVPAHEREIVWSARAAGLGGDVIEDLLLAIAEVASADDGALVRAERLDGEWVCEVAGDFSADPNGFGIAIGRLICERVELGDGRVRFVFGTAASPRDRILAACAHLFAEHGVRGTGINAILARARVAKATFYAYFASKNDVVLAWLQSSPVAWFDAARSEVEVRATAPDERLLMLFDVVGEWLTADDFHGCQTFKTALETPLAGPALAELESEIEDYLRSTCREAGIAAADDVAEQLRVLLAGAISSAVARGSAEPARAAKRAAARVLLQP